MQTVLYTRRGCHLCEVALQTLTSHGLQPTLVDIDQPSVEFASCGQGEDLVAQFGNCVPVVAIDGKVRFRGQVDPRLLKRLLRGGPG